MQIYILYASFGRTMCRCKQNTQTSNNVRWADRKKYTNLIRISEYSQICTQFGKMRRVQWTWMILFVELYCNSYLMSRSKPMTTVHITRMLPNTLFIVQLWRRPNWTWRMCVQSAVHFTPAVFAAVHARPAQPTRPAHEHSNVCSVRWNVLKLIKYIVDTKWHPNRMQYHIPQTTHIPCWLFTLRAGSEQILKLNHRWQLFACAAVASSNAADDDKRNHAPCGFYCACRARSRCCRQHPRTNHRHRHHHRHCATAFYCAHFQ